MGRKSSWQMDVDLRKLQYSYSSAPVSKWREANSLTQISFSHAHAGPIDTNINGEQWSSYRQVAQG